MVESVGCGGIEGADVDLRGVGDAGLVLRRHVEVLRVDDVRDSASRTWEWMVKAGSACASALSVRECCQEVSGVNDGCCLEDSGEDDALGERGAAEG